MTKSTKRPGDADPGRGDGDLGSRDAGTKGFPPSSPPPKGPRMSWVVGLVVLLLASFWVGGAWGDHVATGLARIWRALPFGGTDSGTDQDSEGYFTCGMHPWVILPDPGICPVCRMDLTPLDPAKFSGELKIDPVVVQNIGVRIEEVTTGPLVRNIRTVATVAYDETAVRDVNIKVKGWIEELHVDYLGAAVKKGDPLFDLYSPDLYDTQQQYLVAYRNRNQKEIPFLPGAERYPMRLLESSRIRLEYLDITPEQIEELEESGRPSKTMVIASPHTGVVIAKHANEGMLVDPGMLVYRIADLSKVWVLVTLYEVQIPYVSVGQTAVMTLPYIPGQTYEGKVIYIYPFIESATREVQVRLEFDNPGMFLKPGMFANVELQSTLAEDRTLVPRAAVIDTGEREVAFVSLGEGRFEPRDVRLGVESGDGMVEVLDGLRPGEFVVTSGQFLLDSEAKVREALAKMLEGKLASKQRSVAPVAGKSELEQLPVKSAAALSRVLDAYVAAGEVLAGDTVEDIDKHSREIAQGVDDLLATSMPDDPHFWHRHMEAATVRGKALELATESGIAGARLKYADLSVALSKLVKATGVPRTYRKAVQELHCPMFREQQGGAVWLQLEGDVRNPFFGATMLRCFDRRVVLPVTGGKDAGGDDSTDPVETTPDSDRTSEEPGPEGEGGA